MPSAIRIYLTLAWGLVSILALPGWAQVPAAADRDSEIAAWIERLRSPEYQVRQQAWGELRRLGRQAESELQAALAGADSEMRERLQMLLTGCRFDVPLEAPLDFLESLSRFPEMPEESQRQFLNHLAARGSWKLVVDLLRDLPNQEQAFNLQRDSFDLRISLIELLLKHRSAEVRGLLQHPFVRHHYAELCVAYGDVAGVLATDIEAVAKQAAAGDLPSQEYRFLVLGLARLGRLAEAREQLARMEPDPTRSQLEQTILTDAGDWAALWELVKHEPLPTPEQLNQPSVSDATVRLLLRRLTLAKILKREGDYQEARNGILQTLASPTAKDQEPLAVHESLARGLLLNGEFDSAQEYFQRTSPATALKLANFLMRLDVGRTLIQFDDEVERRWKAWESRFNRLAGLERRFASGGDEQIGKQIMAAHDLILEGAECLSLLGFNEDAAVLLETALSQLKDDHQEAFTRRQAIIEQLAEMRVPDLWSLVERHFDENNYQYWYLQSSLFASQVALANFWYGEATQATLPASERLKTVAQMLNDPNAPPAQPGLVDSLLDQVDRSNPVEMQQEPRGAIHYQLGLTCRAHGREDEAQEFFRTARLHYRHPDASMALAIHAYDRQQWNEVVTNLSSVVDGTLAYRNPLSLLMLYRAQAELGQVAESQDALLAALLATQGIESNVLIQDLINNGFHREVARFGLSRFANTLAYGKFDPTRSARESLAQILELCDTEQFGLWNVLYPASLFREALIREGCALAAAGQPDLAQALVQQHGQLLFADASLTENLVGQMKQLGQTEPAQQIFNWQADWFRTQLEAYPNSNLLLNNYAWICVCANRNLDQATFCSDRSLQIRPRQKHYLDTRAALHALQGDLKAAFELTRQCLMQDPDNPHYRRQLAKYREAISAANGNHGNN